MTCTCEDDSIDGYDITDLDTWELALRNAAHGHYPLAGMEAVVLPDAVREIDRLRLDAIPAVAGELDPTHGEKR